MSTALAMTAEQNLASVLSRTFTATELCAREFPEPTWIIPNLLPEGLCILAGKPKTGKSWLALNIAAAVSAGGFVLGTTPVERGEVLYLALEDSERRLKKRFDLISAIPTDKLQLCTAWTRGEQALADLRLWLKSNPKTRLVIIDTLARIREPSTNGYSYLEDYQYICSLKAIADVQHVTIVLIHHTRKMGAEDFTDMLSGTTGIAGAADTIMVLQRPRAKAEATLSVTGRDIEEQELALRYQPEIGWTALGDAGEYRQSTERQEILRVVKQAPEAIGPKEVAAILDKNASTTAHLMAKMENEGLLVKIGYGKYRSMATVASMATMATVASMASKAN